MSKLQDIRKANNLSQSKLAEKSGVNLRMVQNYELGFKDINKAQAITLYKLAQALDCTIEDLLELNN
jgi:transcriptional regulator with XRE-family HTH domain